MISQGLTTNKSSLTKIKKECAKLKDHLPQEQKKNGQVLQHRILNAYVHAYKNMLRLKSIQEEETGGQIVFNVKSKDSEDFLKSDPFCSTVDFKVIDFLELTMTMLKNRGISGDETYQQYFKENKRADRGREIVSKIDNKNPMDKLIPLFKQYKLWSNDEDEDDTK